MKILLAAAVVAVVPRTSEVSCEDENNRRYEVSECERCSVARWGLGVLKKQQCNILKRKPRIYSYLEKCCHVATLLNLRFRGTKRFSLVASPRPLSASSRLGVCVRNKGQSFLTPRSNDARKPISFGRRPTESR
jgi:hypothetical protein